MSAAAASRDITLVSFLQRLSHNTMNIILDYSSTRWTRSTSTLIRLNQQCAHLYRRVVPSYVAMKWKSGVHQKRISLKKHLTNMAKTLTTSEMIL